MYTWNDVLGGLVLILMVAGMFAFYFWLARAAAKEQKETEQWFQKRLETTAWQVEPGERRLRSLEIPADLLRQYPRWSQVRMVCVCKKDQRVSWFFRLRPHFLPESRRYSRYSEIVCVVQASRFDLPRVTLRRKSYRRRVRLPRSSRRVRELYPDLCRHWVLYAEDEGQPTLSLLSSLKGVLEQGRHTRIVNVAPDYVAIAGEPAGCLDLREELFEFIREVRCILQSIGEPDPFDGAFGSGGLPEKRW